MTTAPDNDRDESLGQNACDKAPERGRREPVDLSGATEREIARLDAINQQLAHLRERLTDKLAVPEGVIQAWSSDDGDIDEFTNLASENGAILDAIRLRTASRLRPATDAERENLEDDCPTRQEWAVLNDQGRYELVTRLANEIAAGPWAPHTAARPRLVADAMDGRRSAFRALLRISRGIDPDEGIGPDARTAQTTDLLTDNLQIAVLTGRGPSEDLGQVIITVGPDDDLVWAEEKPGLTPGERGQFFRHRADHAKWQLELREAVHGIWFAVAAIQRDENPESAKHSTLCIQAPSELLEPPAVLEAYQMLWHVSRIREQAANQRSTLLHYVSETNWALEQQQVSWIDREVAPLQDWVDYRARRAIWPDLVFCPQVHLGGVRRLPPNKRHHIAWSALGGPATARVERLLDDIERLLKELSGSWVNVVIGVQAWSSDASLAQNLIREAARLIEIESLSQDLDPYCARRGDPRGLPGRGNFLEYTPMILSEPAYPALLSRCGETFWPSDAFRATDAAWLSFSTIQRAYAVNAVVVRARDSQPGSVVQMSNDDLVAAANGDVAAWARLRAAREDSVEDAPGPSAVNDRFNMSTDGVAPEAGGAESAHSESTCNVAANQRYEQPFKGRFTWESVFLHEVGWILTKIAPTSVYPSLETVSAWFERCGGVRLASARALKTATTRWYGSSWPRAREAAASHYAACTQGPSCVPPDVRQ